MRVFLPAVFAAILAGVINTKYQTFAESHATKQQRHLMTPAEVLQMPSHRMIIFTGKDCPPIYAQKLNYFDCSDMAGLYFPNPYHPPINKVQVKTWYGRAWKQIIEIDPPKAIRDYPQYQGRMFRYVEGYKPPL